LQGRSDLAARVLHALLSLCSALVAHWARIREVLTGLASNPSLADDRPSLVGIRRPVIAGAAFTTGC